MLRLNYDDDLTAAMDKVNKALAPYGIQFVDDEEIHEGFCLYSVSTKKLDVQEVKG